MPRAPPRDPQQGRLGNQVSGRRQLVPQGSPENYADVKICLDPPEETLAFLMSAEMVEVMCAATICAFGEVGEYESGEYGPGL